MVLLIRLMVNHEAHETLGPRRHEDHEGHEGRSATAGGGLFRRPLADWPVFAVFVIFVIFVASVVKRFCSAGDPVAREA
jgi:hypothetical protein